ncbi:Acetyl-CoA biotin carboxyl carrier [Novipirellula aureliae]|uniref:Biotin carboxyl carrier protein of acetyl-CoA carboxylase n=1 Tax=Novipirellula aureliae TaxID=2527966 RepID=A0A5C6DQP2_9BACT|nr:acetyl-CoA carboxylase biotin carboxyl carrier protein [Novipirellula aureliae]TWU38952.1 Acetyl-CoA biotin carboxyl carrier [Novipirellula aureliae]
MSKGGKANLNVPNPSETDPKSASVNVFDIDRLRTIIELMEEKDLSEVDLQQGDEKIKLNRGSVAPVMATAPVPAQPAAATPSATAADQHAGTVTINSPMVGTFYTKATPESEPFVKVGQRVTEETIVCIVEAMKVFNEIPAECSGTIVEVLVSDQQPVDFGKPMFRVEPNA